MTNWPELGKGDRVLYANDLTRPNRLVLTKVPEGYGLRIDTPMIDGRQAPFLSKEVLLEIAFKIIRAVAND